MVVFEDRTQRTILVREHRTQKTAISGRPGRNGLPDQAANFISLIASKSCTPPPTRLVV